MRKFTIIPAVALSLMTMGMIAEATPVGAQPMVHMAGEDDDDNTTRDTTQSSGGGSGAPSGGAATGAGGTASDSSSSAPIVPLTLAGIGLVGVAATTARRRSVNA